MAAARRTAAGRTNAYRSGSDVRSMYVYGNTVTKPDYTPRRGETPKEDPRRDRKRERRARQQRRKALRVGKRYVVFLSAAALMALFICVNYVSLQAEITSRSNNITAMQEELADMREENTTKYNAVIDSVNLDQIKQKAVDEMGMVPALGSQIVEYDSPDDAYVTQYEEIPESGIIASADTVQN